jgi:hypothetical protein
VIARPGDEEVGTARSKRDGIDLSGMSGDLLTRLGRVVASRVPAVRVRYARLHMDTDLHHQLLVISH